MSEKSAREYAETECTWRDTKIWNDRETFTLYKGVQSRFQVTVQRNAEMGFGLQRHEEAAERGIDIGALDDKEFADDFCKHFVDHLSLNEMQVLIQKLTEAKDAWEAERERMMGL